MKSIPALLFLLLLGGPAVAQKKPKTPAQTQQISGGKNYITGEAIPALRYDFPERIENFYIDTLSRQLTVQTRGLWQGGPALKAKGKMIRYDLDQHKTGWENSISYTMERYSQYGSTLIQTTANKSTRLDINTGLPLWEATSSFYHVNEEKKTALGYKFNSFMAAPSLSKLQGYDLQTGQDVWDREISREWGWNDLFYLNENTLLVVASGLHTVDINNGMGWDFPAVTGRKDYTGVIAANALGLAAGLLTGTYVMSTGADVVRELVSNVLHDDNNLYFASGNMICRLDSDGQLIWSKSLPEEHTSKSTIFIKEGVIYLINRGYAFMGYRKIHIGTPFLAAFRQFDGAQLYFKLLGEGKKDAVNGLKLTADHQLHLLFKNRLETYDLTEGVRTGLQSFNAETKESLEGFVGSQVYLQAADSTFTSLAMADGGRQYVFTSEGKIFALDTAEEGIEEIPGTHLWTRYYHSEELIFLARKNKTIVLDPTHQKVATLNASKEATVVGTRLYDRQGKGIFSIDLSSLGLNEGRGEEAGAPSGL
jgi:hypothetical protein